MSIIKQKKKLTAILSAAALLIAMFSTQSNVHAGTADKARTLNVKVIGIDPVITSPAGGKVHASEYLGYSLTDCTDNLKQEIEDGTQGLIKINITETTRFEEFPTYNGYKSMTEEQFHILFPYNSETGQGEWYGWWERDAEYHVLEEGTDMFNFDYEYFLENTDLVKERNEGKFDAVWVFSIDPSSMFETCMVGKNPVEINGAPFEADCDNFLLAGLTFSRPDGALESICHSFEAMMNHTYNVTEIMYNAKFSFKDYDELSGWEKFYYNKHKGADGKDVYGVGQVHFSPNSEGDYDWENNTKVYSYYDQFAKNYPAIDPTKPIEFTADSAYMDNELYAKYNTPAEKHHVWWLNCMPHFKGRDPEGYSLNWYDYGFSTKYTSGIAGSAEYKDDQIEMEVGDSIENLKFLRYYNDSDSFETLTADSDNAFIVADGDAILLNEDGTLQAKAEGTAEINIRVDGFSFTYKVTVKKKIEATPTPEVTPTPTPQATPEITPTPGKEDDKGLKIGDTYKTKTAEYKVISDSELMFIRPIKKSGTVKVPDTITINGKKYKVTAIKDKAFYKDKKIKKLIIGKNVTKIGAKAFKGCKKLKSIKTKSTGLSFGKECFKGIYKKAVFKVPKSKINSYKKNLIKKGKAPKKIKVKKY